MAIRHHRIAAGCALAALAAFLPPAARAASGPHQGFLYGTVETRSGASYTGLLRWGREEAFWDDLFNATKPDEPATIDRVGGHAASSFQLNPNVIKLDAEKRHRWQGRDVNELGGRQTLCLAHRLQPFGKPDRFATDDVQRLAWLR